MKNALVLQSGGMTAVINASLVGVVRAGKGVFEKIYGARYGVHGLVSGDVVDLSGLSDSELDRIEKTPSGVLGSSRVRLNEELTERAFKNTILPNEIEVVFVIGGNDTAYNGKFLSEYSQRTGKPIQVIGIPKTIDNDLPYMYFCPGYPSIARYIAISTQEAGLDTLAMRHSDPVKIIEVMGRNAGWIVCASALLKKNDRQPPHLLGLPEIPLDVDEFVEKVERIYKEYGFVVAVVSETVRDKTGVRIGEKKEGITSDGFGHQYVESASQRLCSIIEKRLGLRARWDRPGTLQRMSACHVSEMDRRTARGAGEFGVELARRGMSGVEVTIEEDGFGWVEIEKIAEKERLLPEEFRKEETGLPTKGFYDYALPLLGDGLPDYSWMY